MKTYTIFLTLFLAVLWSAAVPSATRAGDAPAWMHTAAALPLAGPVDEKADAIVLYEENVTIVQPDGKFKTIERRVLKIMRPGGRQYGMAFDYSRANRKITGMRGWCIPAQGKDYEVKDKEAMEGSVSGVDSSELMSDVKEKWLKIPAADPGNIVGYEIEVEERPFVLEDEWIFQSSLPARESRYTLELPSGWEYKATWLNHGEVAPTSAGANRWQWVVQDTPAIRHEESMPPWRGVAGQMIVSLFPPGGSDKRGMMTWAEVGKWDTNLTQGRRDASPEIKQKVAELTAGKSTQLEKMQAIGAFVQRDVRYVAIELGIGGWQPHAAAETFSHRYGDCKDKATLTSSMLREIGIESFYLDINVWRGAVSPQTPPQPFWFNHEILGVRLPDDMKDASLVSVYTDPKLGRILIFDPTDDLTPFGQLRGPLQANYGLLVTPDGGELIKTPELASSSSGQRRTGKFALSSNGRLGGDVLEIFIGDNATQERGFQEAASTEAKRIQRIESTLSNSLGTFQITNATLGNLKQTNQPFQYTFSFTADNYAKTAGSLLLVRPRVMGTWSSDILEKKESRKYAVEFHGPWKNEDTYEITLPSGYVADELPPPVDAEFSFASYHSKSEVKGGVMTYKRTMEIKQLTVPVEKLAELKTFYRTIAGDERNTAVLKPAAQ